MPVKTLLECRYRTGPYGSQAVVDGTFSEKPFLPMSAKELMVSGQYNENIDLLLGCNKEDGLVFTNPIYANHSLMDEWRSQWMDGRGAFDMLGIEKQDIDDEAAGRVEEITKFYLESLEYMTFDNVTQVTKMYTDSWFCYAAYDFVSRHIANVKQNNTYQYLYTHQGEHSLYPNKKPQLASSYGVAHADELFLQFLPYAKEEVKLNSDDEEMSGILMSLWKSFIKGGNPSTDNVVWEPIVSNDDRKYLCLNQSATMDGSSAIDDRMVFWDGLMNGIYDLF